MEFEEDKDTIDRLTRNISLDDLNIQSTIKDDNNIIALLIKNTKLKYKCSEKGCNIIKSWNNKPIKLLLVRKNNRKQDLRIKNLELKCYNCYFQSNSSLELFKKVKNRNILKCKLCDFIISNQSKKYKNNKLCKICYEKYITDRVKIKEHKTMWNTIVNENFEENKAIEINKGEMEFVEMEDNIDEEELEFSNETMEFDLNNIEERHKKEEETSFFENLEELNEHIDDLRNELIQNNLIN